MSGRIALRADENLDPRVDAPPPAGTPAASLSLLGSPSAAATPAAAWLAASPWSLARALTGGFETGSWVRFSSAGRPGSIPVNACPFAAYEPLLKSDSARTLLGPILADNRRGFQGRSKASRAACGLRKQKRPRIAACHWPETGLVSSINYILPGFRHRGCEFHFHLPQYADSRYP